MALLVRLTVFSVILVRNKLIFLVLRLKVRHVGQTLDHSHRDKTSPTRRRHGINGKTALIMVWTRPYTALSWPVLSICHYCHYWHIIDKFAKMPTLCSTKFTVLTRLTSLASNLLTGWLVRLVRWVWSFGLRTLVRIV